MDTKLAIDGAFAGNYDHNLFYISKHVDSCSDCDTEDVIVTLL